ncbi:MAG TPA: C13 family peptidase [Vicinamibacterales bacterium]|nr:C13 family peptidase [Vicinamibacterales bacterium]
MLHAFLLVLVGLAGDPEHGELFHKWGGELAESAGRLGVPADHVVYLVDQTQEGDKNVTGKATVEEISKTFDRFAKQATPEDAVYVVLIGHGSYDGKTAKFNLPGPDMSAADFNTQFRKLPTKHIVFVDTTSASGPFINDLSAPERTIITATRNGAENYSTLFGGYFVDALTGDEADADKNRRVSMLEAFQFAKAAVQRAYEKEGLLSTEHALLDDNGDKAGSADPSTNGPDGKVASLLAIGSAADAAALPTDPKLRALVLEQRELEHRVESLRLLKENMEPAKYQSELEKLVTDLALKTREIRSLEGAK